MGNCKYYKQVLPQIITFFYTEDDNVLGMFREVKTKKNLSIMRDIDTSIWRNISINELAQTLVDHSEEITKIEYETAKYLVDTFIDCDYWLISEDKVPETMAIEKKVVSETVYC